MTRDYKNISESKSRAKKTGNKLKNETSSEGLSVWFWLISGVVIGAFVSFLIYLKLNVDVESHVVEKVEGNLQEKAQKKIQEKVNAKQQTSPAKKSEESVEEKSRFEFYSILPKREIEIPAEEDVSPREVIGNKMAPPPVIVQEPSQKKSSPEIRSPELRSPELRSPELRSPERVSTDRLYVLQVGSFTHFKDADKRKANLAFLGIESKIHSISNMNKKVYRVQIGPYANLDKINGIASTLKQNKIPSLLMKVKG